ncbi:MAG: 1,4-alpha-glucan branching protein [Candidatus Wallbacteria bacterium HGW-Wallbacteria-1]|jgi:1,4-alpha-glucan branching enzyme|uniref:1,4-alpha-glucan branching enzyme n=1 Tax=Candidatus Wallbacteria bacterium HGW-Wallbacteria-1 TaxID=2013854 RepID=A0A2N1PIF2_9BACT|nr:MAG: 1,4-alpha-glucan branching protein [Candidatus Wallbacteria bacterium HGW-Wallbacteria-1]
MAELNTRTVIPAPTRNPMGAVPFIDGCRFSVWAPHADQVYVTGTFNDWNSTTHPMNPSEDGIWTLDVKNAGPGHEYRFRIISGDSEFSRIDPYARNVTNSNGNSVITELFMPGNDSVTMNFSSPDISDLVIYELHIGTFGKQGETPGPGDLEGALKRLPYLKELGINAIEVMPLAEFAGGYSWGYNPAQIFAVESDYGLPNDFRNFIDKAHELGIAVILDVVYNHFGPGDLDLWQFDGWSENNGGGIYFYNDWRAKTPWGDTRPDYREKRIRQYICDNALMWLEEYGVDGLRWDMTAYIRNVHGNNSDKSADLPEGWNLMQWVNQEIRSIRPDAITIAEDLQENPYLTRNQDEGGAGFDAQWCGPFVHTVRSCLLLADDSELYMEKLKNAILQTYDQNIFQRVIYTESHDEVASGKARVPEEIDPGSASSLAAMKKSTLGAVMVFTSPGIPMIFQGQEFLEDDWFQDQDPLDWAKTEQYAGIVRLYSDLIHLRRNINGLTGGLMGQNTEVHHIDEENKIIAWHRWESGGPLDSVVIIANFSARHCTEYIIPFPSSGEWQIRFNSDSRYYSETFTDFGSTTVWVENPEQPIGKISIAPYSALIMSLNG